MKTKKCRPVLVECEEKSKKGDLVIDPSGLGIDISEVSPSLRNKQQLTLISLEDEKIEEDDLVLFTEDGEMEINVVNGKYSDGSLKLSNNIDNEKATINKIVATQSQLSPEYIQQFIKEYNEGNVKDIEIEMNTFYELNDPMGKYTTYEPNLTNGFITIVDKEPIIYTEDEVETMIHKICGEMYQEKCVYSVFRIVKWFQENKKKSN